MAEPLRYHALQKIADGGSAEVFLGEQVGAAGFKRPVVLKRIRTELYADDQYRVMLLEEAHLAMSLHHSNLVEVLDVGESSGRYFLVLELVDGWTLHQVLRRARDANLPLPPELAVYLVAEVCRGLAYAHQRTEGGVPLDIVHHDVCPNNVLVSMHAEVKLTDFGIARARTRTAHTRVGRIKGKPAFMSPEQARGEALDARSDLFSVGTVLYALLTDTLPFDAANDREVLRHVSEAEVKAPSELRPGLPRALDELVLKAMAKKRDDRFASAQEMLGALEQVQRTALTPAGRSELENYLRTLSAKDGVMAITRQTMPPAAPAVDPDQWIALSSERPVAMEWPQPPRFPTLPAMMAARRPSRWPVAVGVLLVLAVGAAWLISRGPAPRGGSSSVPGSTADREDDLTDVTSEWAAPPSRARRQDAEAVEAVEPTAPVVANREPTSRSGVPGLRLSARLAPNQKPGALMIAVIFESEPSGVLIRVDKRELGRTPAVLRFKNGLTFDLWFEAKGRPPLRQWLMLTERPGKLPKVTLRAPLAD